MLPQNICPHLMQTWCSQVFLIGAKIEMHNAHLPSLKMKQNLSLQPDCYLPGTFITEWTEGSKVCEEFLKDAESYRLVADKLVQISHYHGFDGWLINIENSLSLSIMDCGICNMEYMATCVFSRYVLKFWNQRHFWWNQWYACMHACILWLGKWPNLV